ncbi:hypothetical protein AMTR_s00117p00083340 [Amborella trichopoda]|uniref:Uncharacterized protein n=1 Tax=Amborella trichopoda TaxID=13333 RepID=W1NTM6_AMBTC|nr:hypothetical protein AMTR_s00117p00083340 [Amborella trichopoda]
MERPVGFLVQEGILAEIQVSFYHFLEKLLKRDSRAQKAPKDPITRDLNEIVGPKVDDPVHVPTPTVIPLKDSATSGGDSSTSRKTVKKGTNTHSPLPTKEARALEDTSKSLKKKGKGVKGSTPTTALVATRSSKRLGSSHSKDEALESSEVQASKLKTTAKKKKFAVIVEVDTPSPPTPTTTTLRSTTAGSRVRKAKGKVHVVDDDPPATEPLAVVAMTLEGSSSSSLITQAELVNSKGKWVVRGILHILGCSPITGLWNIRGEVSPMIEFIGTMGVDTKMLNGIMEGMIPGVDAIASVKYSITHMFPTMITEREQTIAACERAVSTASTNFEVVKDKLEKFQIHFSWLYACKRMVVEEISKMEALMASKKREFCRLFTFTYHLNEMIDVDSFELEHLVSREIDD